MAEKFGLSSERQAELKNNAKKLYKEEKKKTKWTTN